MAPTRTADRATLFLSIGVVIPLQYWLIGVGCYGLFAVLIPVYVMAAMPAMAAAAGDVRDFTARAARLQFGLLLTVYGLSCAPALTMLACRGSHERSGALLLLFLMVVTQVSDVAQYVCGKLWGRVRIAPAVSPGKTVEGLVGGGLVAVGVGIALRGLTPFGPWEAAGMSALIVAGSTRRPDGPARRRDPRSSAPSLFTPKSRFIADITSPPRKLRSPLFFQLTRYFYA